MRVEASASVRRNLRVIRGAESVRVGRADFHAEGAATACIAAVEGVVI